MEKSKNNDEVFERSEKMKYILTTTAKQKNAKRHVVERSEDIEKLRDFGKRINDRYKVDIYTGTWVFVENVK